MEVIKTHCYICNCRCGVLASVENGRVKKVEGDPACEKNEGALCIKGRSMLELVYDEDRLGYPIKRYGSAWKQISWEDALSEISERLLSLKHEFGPESLVLYRGMSVYSWLIGIYARRFVNVYGSPNLTSNAALCVGSKVVATRFTYGKGVSPCGDFRNSKCILLFGTNPAVTGMHRAIRVMKDIMRAKREGAKLIVVDPRRTETASKADIYTTIRPGTDGALVLSLINVIIEKDLYDKSFVSQHTHGFERLKELAGNYTPEKVEKITWVKAHTIRKIAEIFATAKPACADRREGVIHHENGTQTCRTINILNAITGNVDVEGGVLLCTNLLAGSSTLFNELTLKGSFSPGAPSISKENPITQDVPMDVVKAILEGKPYPVRALIVLGSNPLLAWPNTKVIEEALKKLDFLVLVDIYRNDTAKFADIVLPAATFLEKTDIQAPDVAIPRVVQLLEKVVEPANESWPEFKIIQELAKKMGYGEYFRETEEGLIDKVLNHWGLSVDVLRQNSSGMVFEPNGVGYYHRNGFPTGSGKVEIFSEELKTLGFHPLPEFVEPSESPFSNPALAEEYPLVLVTGNRVRSSYLSFLHNLPSLHRRNPENWVEIHPETARARGIKDAEIVTVESPRGKIELKAKLNSSIDPRVVFTPYGWGHYYDGSWQLANSTPGENVNILTDNELTDAMSGMPNYKSLLCQVRK